LAGLRYRLLRTPAVHQPRIDDHLHSIISLAVPSTAGGRVFFDIPTLTSGCPGSNVRPPPFGAAVSDRHQYDPRVLLRRIRNEADQLHVQVIFGASTRNLMTQSRWCRARARPVSNCPKGDPAQLNSAQKTLTLDKSQTCRTLEKLTARAIREVVMALSRRPKRTQLCRRSLASKARIGCR